MAKSNPVDYFGISGVVCDFSSSKEEIDDDYFPQPNIGKISHLNLEDLEVEKPKGSSSLLAGISVFSLPLSYYKIFMTCQLEVMLMRLWYSFLKFQLSLWV